MPLTKKINTMVPGAFPIVQKAFETIGYAKVSFSAKQAMSYGYLRDDDIIVLQSNDIVFLHQAQQFVLPLFIFMDIYKLFDDAL